MEYSYQLAKYRDQLKKWQNMAKIIILDFDGTCVPHNRLLIDYDNDAIGAVPVLQELVANGFKLILFTVRSNIENPTSTDPNIITKGGNYLDDAVNWFKRHDIPLFGVQTNPEQHTFTTSPKPYGDIIIDDNALGAPLKSDSTISDKPFIDWKEVQRLLCD